MNQALQPLLMVLQHAERERDFALTAQQRAQHALNAAQQQAEQLALYRREYEQRWGTQFQQASAVEVVRCYQGFMGRLQLAVDQQQQQVALAAAALEGAQETLRGHEMRVASVRKLIERRQHEAARIAGQREQKATDEQAARAAWHRRPMDRHTMPGALPV